MGSSGGIRVDTSQLLTVGQETMPRLTMVSNVNLASGFLRLSYFTARKTEIENNIRTSTGNTAAGATPTLCRMGLYSVDGLGNLTLLGACANDTTLWAATTALYSRGLTSPVAVVAGQRYAFAAICVTAFTVPTLMGAAVTGNPGEHFLAPTLIAQLGGQADLPATVAVGSLVSASNAPYGVITP